MKIIFGIIILFISNSSFAKGSSYVDEFQQIQSNQKPCFVEVSSKTTININYITSFEKTENDSVYINYGKSYVLVKVGDNQQQDVYIKRIITMINNCK